jgi:hypothetical protein
MPAKTRSSRSGAAKGRQLVLGANSDTSSCDTDTQEEVQEEEGSDDSMGTTSTARHQQRQRRHSHDYSSTGTFYSPNETQAEVYVDNCRKYEVPVDPGCVQTNSLLYVHLHCCCSIFTYMHISTHSHV